MTVKIYQAKNTVTGWIETVVLCDRCYGSWNPAEGITLLAEANKPTPCQECKPTIFADHLEQMRDKLNG